MPVNTEVTESPNLKLAAEATPQTALVPVAPVLSRRPIATILLCALMVFVFGLFLVYDDPPTQRVLFRYFWTDDIFATYAYWTLLTSSMLHLEFWHIAFNAYWLWIFGTAFERQFGSLKFLGFFAAAAVIASGFQIAFSSSTGIGASGVGYALFGFIAVTRRRYPPFAAALNIQLIALFLIWLVGCWIATVAGVTRVGNAAHIGGLLFGVNIAALTVIRWKPRLMWVALVVICAIVLIPLLSPWMGG